MRYTGAYLVRGGDVTLPALVDRLEKEMVTRRGSPDLFARAYRAFGVDEADELRRRARARPLVDPQRVFALFVPSITHEAQNALLKTLEEPLADAVFFLISPAPETLLPTIRSRSQVLVVETKTQSELKVDAQAFLAASAEKRIAMLKSLYEHDLPAGGEGRDVGGVIAFLGALEQRIAAGEITPQSVEGIRAIYRARKYATDKGSLLKSLLESVALLTPAV